jgi:hypothetical protein
LVVVGRREGVVLSELTTDSGSEARKAFSMFIVRGTWGACQRSGSREYNRKDQYVRH